MGKRALIIGASGGVGSAVSAALESRGYNVTGLSRREHGLDVTSDDSIARHLEQLRPGYDLVFVAVGQLAAQSGPEKSLKSLTPQEMAHLFAVNAIGPSLVLKHAIPLLRRDQRAIFAALSARVGSIGDNALGGWYSYRASKAALNQMIHTAAIELKRSHKHLICVALHPGTVATEFTRNYCNHAAVPADQAADNLVGVLDGLTPENTGGFYDWRGAPVPW